jgi:hypothetical protein
MTAVIAAGMRFKEKVLMATPELHSAQPMSRLSGLAACSAHGGFWPQPKADFKFKIQTNRGGGARIPEMWDDFWQ